MRAEINTFVQITHDRWAVRSDDQSVRMHRQHVWGMYLASVSSSIPLACLLPYAIKLSSLDQLSSE